jgi:hypothetical protein
MKYITLIIGLFVVGCSNQDAEIKNLTDAYTKLQTENTRIHEGLKSLREEYRRLVAVGNDTWVYAHLKVEMTYSDDNPLPKYSVVYRDLYRQDAAMGKDLESALESVAASMKLPMRFNANGRPAPERLSPPFTKYKMPRYGFSLPLFLSDIGDEGWELTGTTTYSISKRRFNKTTIFENFYFKRSSTYDPRVKERN